MACKPCSGCSGLGVRGGFTLHVCADCAGRGRKCESVYVEVVAWTLALSIFVLIGAIALFD